MALYGNLESYKLEDVIQSNKKNFIPMNEKKNQKQNWKINLMNIIIYFNFNFDQFFLENIF